MDYRLWTMVIGNLRTGRRKMIKKALLKEKEE
jgi:hypothetical protein